MHLPRSVRGLRSALSACALSFATGLFCATPAAAQQSVRIVDFGHDWGVGFYRDIAPQSLAGIDVNANGSTDDDLVRVWPFSLSTPLNPAENTYDSQLPSARFYGGIYGGVTDRPATVPDGYAGPRRTSNALTEGHINQNHELRDDWNLMQYPTIGTSPELDRYEAAGLWLWKKDDFLNGAHAPGSNVAFASADDYITAYVSRYWGGVNWGRWVVQDGSQFYISEPTFGDSTTQIYFLRDANGVSISDGGGGAGGMNPVYKTAQTVRPTTVRWAPYDPTRPAPRKMFFDWQANPDYQFRTFNNVQSVGFLVQKDLAWGAQAAGALSAFEPTAVKWNAFQVVATVTPASPVLSPHLDLLPVGGTAQAPALLAARTEVTYEQWLKIFRWADTNQRPRNYTDGVERHIPSYSFERDGAIGSSEASLAPSHSPLEPVTTISWYDAVLWCNALSELEGLPPAYYADPSFTTPFREVFQRHLPRHRVTGETATRHDRKPVYWNPASAGYRLPTEGEWKALVADASDAPAAAWTSANADNKTRPVATLAANSLGLHDLIGNVAEFIWDAPASTFDPAVHTTRTVLGGSFRLPADENASTLIPFDHRPWPGTYSVGFRPVRNGHSSLPAGSATVPSRAFTAATVVPPAAPMSDEALRIQARTTLALVEVAGAGTLAPGSTETSLVTTSPYPVEVAAVETPYALWIRVKQWAEANHGYFFNYSGDMGSARHNPHLSRGPDEPATQLSWFDAIIWCNALSELLNLEPVYLDANGNPAREASPFRLSAFNLYGYPNPTGAYGSTRDFIDTAMNFTLAPNPLRTGFRLPTRTEARAYGATVFSHVDSANFTTNTHGWFRTDPVFNNDASLLKAMPVGTKTPRTQTPGLHDILGNVQEWAYGGGALFGQYRYGNDFGWAHNKYPHTMNREDHVSSARPYLGFRVIKVAGDGNVPPSFSADPISRPLSYVNQAYSGTVAGAATDPNPGDVITYSKTAGPAWLSIAADGVLSGTPGPADAGINSFTLAATDYEGLSTSVTLEIEVSAAALPPSFDPPAATFEGAGVIALTSTTPGVSGFHYTTDGSTPSASHGTPTSGSVTVSTAGSITVRAVSLHPTLAASAPAEATYTVVAGTPPSVSVSPASQTVGEGWSASFTATASGTAPLSYQWLLDGATIPGATSESYELPSATSANAGDYTVVVTSPYGSDTSDASTLTVLAGLTSTNPAVSVEPSPLVHSALPNTTSTHPFTVQNTGLAELTYAVTLPAGSGAPAPSVSTLLDWNYASAADGLGLNQVANTGSLAASWGALTGASTLDGKIRIRNSATAEAYAGANALGFTSGVHTLEVELAGWNVPADSTGQWFQLSFHNDTSSGVTAGLVLQTNASGLALWGRALGTSTGGTNLSGTGTWIETSSTEGIGTRTPIRQYGWSESGPVTLRVVADFGANTYEIYYRDSSTAGAFVKATHTGAIASDRDGRNLRLRSSGDWSLSGEFIDVSRITVTGPASVAPPPSTGEYTVARSTQGGPAYAWREIASTAAGGTLVGFSAAPDDVRVALNFPLGFSFPFYGTSFTSVSVGSNGFLSFTSTSTSYSNLELPNVSAPRNLLALLWDDLKFDTASSAWWRLDPDGLVITYNNVHRYGNTTLRLTAQAILHTDGRITFQYHTIQPSTTWSATIGIQDAAGTAGTLVSYNNASTRPTAGEAVTFFPPGAESGGPAWLTSVTPDSGSLSALASQSVQLGFDTADLTLGTYEATVVVSSNDPATPSFTLPLTLHVVATLGPPAVNDLVLPAATVGVPFSATFTHSGGFGSSTWSISSGTLPSGLVLAPDGILSGTPATPGDYSFTVRATDDNAQSGTRAFTLAVAPPPAPVVSTTSLPAAEVNIPYSATLAASSGLAPYSWSIASGALPSGLTLATSGAFSGTPAASGDFSFTVRVTDSFGQSSTGPLTLTVAAPSTLTIATESLPAVILNVAYGYTLQSSGGYPGQTWSIDSGTLPSGLSLAPSGLLAGTTSEIGTFPVTFAVSDSQANSASRLFYLVVSATPEGRPVVEHGGWNLHYIRYWSQANFFNDAMFEASDWENNWSAYPFEYDSRGYPINIPAGITPAAKITLHEPGQHTLMWRGEGSVILNGSGISLVASDLTGEVKWRTYHKSSSATDPLLIRVMVQNQVPATDIQVWAPGTAPAEGVAASLFKQSFLDRLKDNSAVLRFMDWGSTNSSKPISWATRRLPSFYTQDSPTAYEHMIALANAADKDLWICVPHLADADYIQRLATLILHGTDDGIPVVTPLAPHLKVYLEWSNEVWNSSFPQHTWAIARAKERLGLDPAASLPNYNEVWKFIGEKHAESFKIFADVFRAADQRSRLVRVLGTQIGGALVDLHMEGVAALANAEPDPALRSEYYPDSVAIGAYFGHEMSTWVLANRPGYTAPTAADFDAAFAWLRSDVLVLFQNRLITSTRAATRHGLDMIAYEGGQHVVGVGGQQSDSALTNFLRAMNRDPRMGELTTLSLDLWTLHNGKLFVAYQDAGPYGSYGSWGFREHWHHSLAQAPKAAAFNEWMRRVQHSHFLTYELPAVSLGDPLLARFSAVELAPPLSYSVHSGALPIGLSLLPDGSFGGHAGDYGTFSFTAQLSDAAGKIDRRFFQLTVSPEAFPVAVTPTADAYVASWATGSNYGELIEMLTGLTSSRLAYSKWDLSGLAGKTVHSAVLHLDLKNASTSLADTTGTLYRHDGSAWTETGLTWTNRPALGTPAATFTVVGSSTPQTVDVTDWVRENRGSPHAGLALATAANRTWHSREASNRPGFQLVIEADPLVLVPSTWDNWLRLHLPSAPEAQLDPLADPDGDGRPNLLEYALGSSPGSADSSAPALQPGPDDTLLFRFPFHAGLRDLRVRVLGSANLVDWNLVLFDSATDAVGYPADWRDIEIDCAPLMQAGATRLFLRLAVDPAP